MNPGRLNIRATLLTKQQGKSDIGSPKDTWVDLEPLYVGLVTAGGKPLDVASRDASEIERVYETRVRPSVRPGLRLRAEGLVLDINRVDPVGTDRVYIYAKTVK
jgi:head-tail adaptor